MIDQDVMDEQQTGTGADDFFATPEIEVPPSPPEAHRAVITSVTLKRIESRESWPVIEIGLQSRDVPTLEDKIGIFLPKTFVDGGGIALGSKFDPSSLPEVKGGFFAEEHTMYARSIANGDKSAKLQKYVFNGDSLARKAGRDPVELGLVRNPQTAEDYVGNIAKMLTGVEVIMLRKERGGDDPAFKHQLQASDIIDADTAEVNPKRLKKFVLAWESQ